MYRRETRTHWWCGRETSIRRGKGWSTKKERYLSKKLTISTADLNVVDVATVDALAETHAEQTQM